MAIVHEDLGNGFVRTYSNSGFKVHGGIPEGDYDVIYHPEGQTCTYVETNIPAVVDPTRVPTNDLSKVKLYRKFRELGIWEQVKAWMQSQDGVWEEWEYSTTLDENNELVQNAVTELKTSLGLSDEEISDIMDASTIQ